MVNDIPSFSRFFMVDLIMRSKMDKNEHFRIANFSNSSPENFASKIFFHFEYVNLKLSKSVADGK